MAFYSSGASCRLILKRGNISKKNLLKKIGKKIGRFSQTSNHFLEKVRKVWFLSFHKPQNKVMKALMMSKKMVLHIFSRHYLIFYGHLESLWSFFTPTANEKIRYLRLLCSIFVVVLPPLVYLLAETWHWAICTQQDDWVFIHSISLVVALAFLPHRWSNLHRGDFSIDPADFLSSREQFLHRLVWFS